MRRSLALVMLTASLAACGNATPSAPTPPPPAPSSPNRSPEIVATITPAIGIDQVTTFTARVEVKDPDGDSVMVTLTSICPFQKDTPVELKGGVGVVSFKPVENCGPTLSFRHGFDGSDRTRRRLRRAPGADRIFQAGDRE